MQVATDTHLIEKGRKYGSITSLAGLAILILGLVISFLQRDSLGQTTVLLVYGCLLVGFILSNIGIYMANKWVREPRSDQLLEKVLKSLDKRYHLYNYCLPAQHVLVTPTGLITLVVKRQHGTISADGDRWQQKLTLGRLLRFLTEEGIGNPSREAKGEASSVARLLERQMPDQEIPVTPMVVLAAEPDKLDANIQNPTVPVVLLADLKERIRAQGQETKPLPAAVSRQLVQVLDEAAGVF